jgi:hypothetical protein
VVTWMLVKVYEPSARKAANPVGNLIAALAKDD